MVGVFVVPTVGRPPIQNEAAMVRTTNTDVVVATTKYRRDNPIIPKRSEREREMREEDEKRMESCGISNRTFLPLSLPTT